MGADLNSVFESRYGIFRKFGCVPSMRDCLRQAPTIRVQAFRSKICYKSSLVAEQNLVSFFPFISKLLGK